MSPEHPADFAGHSCILRYIKRKKKVSIAIDREGQGNYEWQWRQVAERKEKKVVVVLESWCSGLIDLLLIYSTALRMPGKFCTPENARMARIRVLGAH